MEFMQHLKGQVTQQHHPYPDVVVHHMLGLEVVHGSYLSPTW